MDIVVKDMNESQLEVATAALRNGKSVVSGTYFKLEGFPWMDHLSKITLNTGESAYIASLNGPFASGGYQIPVGMDSALCLGKPMAAKTDLRDYAEEVREKYGHLL